MLQNSLFSPIPLRNLTNKFRCLSLSLNLSLNKSQNHPYLDVRGLEVKEEGLVVYGELVCSGH